MMVPEASLRFLTDRVNLAAEFFVEFFDGWVQGSEKYSVKWVQGSRPGKACKHWSYEIRRRFALKFCDFAPRPKFGRKLRALCIWPSWQSIRCPASIFRRGRRGQLGRA